jgi:dihydrolipoamide dehydrogenase
MLDGLMQGADRDLGNVWQKLNAPRFDNIMLKTKTVGAKATPASIEVKFESAEPDFSRVYEDLRAEGFVQNESGIPPQQDIS